MDYLKVSNKYPFEINNLSHYLSQIYCKSLTVYRVNTQLYISMDMDFSAKLFVEISMIIYIGKIIGFFPSEIKSMVATPASDNFLQIIDESKAKFLPK